MRRILYIRRLLLRAQSGQFGVSVVAGDPAQHGAEAVERLPALLAFHLAHKAAVGQQLEATPNHGLQGPLSPALFASGHRLLSVDDPPGLLIFGLIVRRRLVAGPAPQLTAGVAEEGLHVADRER